MKSPPKEKRGVLTALKIAKLLTAYRLLACLQTPFGLVFWKLEQGKARLQDRIENEGSVRRRE
jgi:hypothetical protein